MGFCSTARFSIKNTGTKAAAAAGAAADHFKYQLPVSKNAHLFLSYSHFISPVHQHQISLLLGKLFHLFCCFACDPLPLRHLISIQLVLLQAKSKNKPNYYMSSAVCGGSHCLRCDVSLTRYRGNFQVVANVHSVHVFLWDCVGAVQIGQQTCWLKGHKTH